MMHSNPVYSNIGVHVHADGLGAFRSTIGSFMYNEHEDTYMVDPSSNSLNFDPQQKYPFSEYASFSNVHTPANIGQAQFLGHVEPYTVWNSSVGSYRNMRYNSPGGHCGGNLSDTSSEDAVSPAMVRQPMNESSTGYLSPYEDHQFVQQQWSGDNGLLLTPMATPLHGQTPSVDMKELEFQKTSEYHFDVQEDEVRLQLPANQPEELELSDTVATAVILSHNTSTASSTPSIYASDSSTSSPAHEHDSDSDFDPKRKVSRLTANNRTVAARSQRRTSSSHPILDLGTRVHKSTLNVRPTSNKEKVKSKQVPSVNDTCHLTVKLNTKGPRSFPCAFHAFGCPLTFANKNEWKRHIMCQHLQLGFYRCDLGSCNPNNVPTAHSHSNRIGGPGNRGRGHNKRRSSSSVSVLHPSQGAVGDDSKGHNDFNRKDLFTQHCRRMHGPAKHLLDNTTRTNQAINSRLRAQGRQISGAGKVVFTKDDEAAFESELELIRARCWTSRRYAPERSSCGFCGKVFDVSAHTTVSDGEGKAEERAWEERMEHIGRHYERDGCAAELEGVDQDLRAWGLSEGILVSLEGVSAGAWLFDYEFPKPTSNFEGLDHDSTREGLRRRGPRRRGEIGFVGTSRVSPFIKREDAVVDGSDEDAMAEDD